MEAVGSRKNTYTAGIDAETYRSKPDSLTIKQDSKSKHKEKNRSGKTIVAINQKVGFRLITKFGEKGAVNLGKAVPLVGGIIGATFDSVTTNTVGNIARNTFIV